MYSPAAQDKSETRPARTGTGAIPVDEIEQAERGGGSWASEPDRVYQLLREDLTAGLFAPREPLVESVLAERYSASRTPVRAALLRLVGDRLVEARPHAVSIVRDTTARDVRQIYEVRQALEGFAVESAASVIDRARLERLLVSYDAVPATASTEQGPGATADADVLPLHFLIAQSLGNGRLTDLLFAESLPLARLHALYWRMALPRVDALTEERRRQALQEHRGIAQALLAGSGVQARTLVVGHLRAASDYLISLMASVDLDPTSFSSERRSSDREAVALDHMIPGRPAPKTGPLL